MSRTAHRDEVIFHRALLPAVVVGRGRVRRRGRRGSSGAGGGIAAAFPVNLIDSPSRRLWGEVSALRLSDSALVLVDAVEGVCVQTHAVLSGVGRARYADVGAQQIDRLIAELQLASSAWQHQEHHPGGQRHRRAPLRGGRARRTRRRRRRRRRPPPPKTPQRRRGGGRGAEHRAAAGGRGQPEVQFAPEKGNVLFASAVHGWAFDLRVFARLYARKLGVREPCCSGRRRAQAARPQRRSFTGCRAGASGGRPAALSGSCVGRRAGDRFVLGPPPPPPPVARAAAAAPHPARMPGRVQADAVGRVQLQPKTKKILRTNPGGKLAPMFVQFVLQTLWQAGQPVANGVTLLDDPAPSARLAPPTARDARAPQSAAVTGSEARRGACISGRPKIEDRLPSITRSTTRCCSRPTRRSATRSSPRSACRCLLSNLRATANTGSGAYRRAPAVSGGLPLTAAPRRCPARARHGCAIGALDPDSLRRASSAPHVRAHTGTATPACGCAIMGQWLPLRAQRAPRGGRRYALRRQCAKAGRALCPELLAVPADSGETARRARAGDGDGALGRLRGRGGLRCVGAVAYIAKMVWVRRRGRAPGRRVRRLARVFSGTLDPSMGRPACCMRRPPPTAQRRPRRPNTDGRAPAVRDDGRELQSDPHRDSRDGAASAHRRGRAQVRHAQLGPRLPAVRADVHRGRPDRQVAIEPTEVGMLQELERSLALDQADPASRHAQPCGRRACTCPHPPTPSPHPHPTPPTPVPLAPRSLAIPLQRTACRAVAITLACPAPRRWRLSSGEHVLRTCGECTERCLGDLQTPCARAGRRRLGADRALPRVRGRRAHG